MKKIKLLILFLAFFSTNAFAWVNGGIQGPTSPPPIAALQHSFGDSITQGQASTPVGTGNTYVNGYATLLSIDKSLTLTRRAIPGDMGCDVAYRQIFNNENPGSSINAVYTLMAGFNDANVKNVGAYEVTYNACHQASIAWLGIPSTYKQFGQACSAAGTWTNDTNWITGTARVSTTNGSTLTCTLTTNGGPLYVWYLMHDGDGGTFTYTIDSGSPTSINIAPATAIATQNGGTHGQAIIRLTGLSATLHTITFTVTSSTNVGNSISIGGIGTPPPAGNQDIRYVYVSGITKQYLDVNSAGTAQYNSDAQANQTLFAGDGLLAVFVPVRNFIFGTQPEMGDQLHPNNLGHSEIRDAFESVWH